MSHDAVPGLRAAAGLSQEEVTALRAAGFRSLPAAHALRDLAIWSRRAWRPAVRVHALRALVRSPAALASLSTRAQDMLFAVFRTMNAGNRAVSAQIFGVLLLAEDPWLIDVGGDGADGDAQRAVDAFLRLYDARHQFLGDANAAAGAFADPDVLHRESDAHRRHLQKVAPRAHESALKARRIAVEDARTQRTGAASADPMRAVSVFSAASAGGTEGADRAALENRVAELSREVEGMREQLRENEKRIANLHSMFDFLAKVLLDDFTTATTVLPQLVAQAASSAQPQKRQHKQQQPHSLQQHQQHGLQKMEVEHTSHTGSNGGSVSPPGLGVLPVSPPGVRGAKTLAGPHLSLPAGRSPETLRHRKTAVARSAFAAPHPTPATPAGVAQAGAAETEHRRRLLESFRNVIDASPWTPFPNSDDRTSAPAQPSPTLENATAAEARRGPVRVFRDGRWFEHEHIA